MLGRCPEFRVTHWAFFRCILGFNQESCTRLAVYLHNLEISEGGINGSSHDRLFTSLGTLSLCELSLRYRYLGHYPRVFQTPDTTVAWPIPRSSSIIENPVPSGIPALARRRCPTYPTIRVVLADLWLGFVGPAFRL